MSNNPPAGFDTLSDCQRFRFLTLTCIDLEAAAVAIRALSHADNFPAGVQRKVFVEIMSEAAVVRYLRPFSGSRITSHKYARLPTSYIEALTPEQQRVHHEMKVLRDTMSAHSDIKNREINFTKVPAMYGAKKPGQFAEAAYFHASPDELAALQQIIKALQEAIEVDRRALEDTVPEWCFSTMNPPEGKPASSPAQ